MRRELSVAPFPCSGSDILSLKSSTTLSLEVGRSLPAEMKKLCLMV